MTVRPETTLVAVFSFNRGRHLRRCLASIGRHVSGAPVVVFDDSSTDRATRRQLREAVGLVDVRVTDRKAGTAFGGLYANMAAAVDEAEERGFSHVFFVQDDQQFVRPLDPLWWRVASETYAISSDIAQIVPLFLPDVLGEVHFRRLLALHPSGLFYEEGPAQPPSDFDPRSWGFCDVGLVDVARVRAADLRFGPTELETAIAARARGLRYVRSRDPAMMFSPWPTVSRSRSRHHGGIRHRAIRLFTQINEIGVRAGRAALLDMTATDIDGLLRRSGEELPFAEQHLRADRVLRRPWHYSRAFGRDDLRPKALLTLRWLVDGPADYRQARANLRRAPDPG